MRALAVLVVLSTALLAVSAAAQDAAAPADAAPTDPAELDAAPAADEPSSPPAPLPDEDDALPALREIESRLAVGHPLTDAETDLLLRVARDGKTASERALAAAILPWLPPTASTPALVDALEDTDPRVRAQAVQGLVAVARRLPASERDRVLSAAVRRLDDDADEVACASARLLALVAPAVAADEITRRAPDASVVRHECWRRLVPMEPRAVNVPPPEPPTTAPPESDGPPPAAEPPPPPPTGDWLFVATAASAGFLVGGVLPGVFLPPRDTLTYTERRTIYAREEASIFTAATSAAVGGALLGGAAWGVTALIGPLDVSTATSVALSTTTSAATGLGVGLAFGLSPAQTAGATGIGAASGLVLQSAMGVLLPPEGNDIGFAVGVGGQAALAATLLSLTLVPVGTPTLFDGEVLREDFALGMGLLSGGAVTSLTLLAAPLVDFSGSRTLIASGASLSASALALGLTYLVTPAALQVRERVASGVGVGVQLLTFPLVFLLLPTDWMNELDGIVSTAPTALVLEEDGLKLGLPSLQPIALPTGDAAVGVGLFSGRF